MNFPKHDGALHLTHNEHKSFYQTVQEYSKGYAQFVNDEERKKCFATQDIWVLHWYPNTPIGFHVLAGSTPEIILEAAMKMDGKEWVEA